MNKDQEDKDSIIEEEEITEEEEAKKTVTNILDAFGWETEDMGKMEAAGSIESLCILWCIPGFIKNQWTHAFKLLKK